LQHSVVVNNFFSFLHLVRISEGHKKRQEIYFDLLSCWVQGNATGLQVFIEAHSVTTNEFGLVNLEIGSKNPTGFSDIDWSAGIYFIKISVDNTVMGTSQLLSVPYALYAKTAENGFSGDYNDLTGKPDTTKWDKDSSINVTLTGNHTIEGI
jgi:hypothetical protein